MKLTLFAFAAVFLCACTQTHTMTMASLMPSSQPQTKWCNSKAQKQYDEDRFYGNFGL